MVDSGEGSSDDEVVFRRLGPDEGQILTTAIRAAYGSTYDVRWVYDAAEVRARLTDGRYVSVVAETPAGDLLCHMGLSMTAAGDAVAHSGQAVTLAAARGRHLFTRTKRFLMDWARGQGLAGMYSEVTAAHPYSQRANIDLGAQETGFLLGWIPATVANDAAAGVPRRRQSAAFFYTKLNDGRDRLVYAPERHHGIIGHTLARCELRGVLATPPVGCELAERSVLQLDVDHDHNLALITVTVPGADLEEVVRARRHRLFHHDRVDAVYLDLPLTSPGTALVADDLEALGVSYSGIFPNHRADGDVLRMQSLHRVRITADDVVVASEHGRELLDYVLADLPAIAAG
jgi:serine/threonine-protein kinase RsbW